MTREYLAYLESPEWWHIRRRALQRAGYRCERCGLHGPLQVHHVTYRHLGDEHPDDLEVLCAACHRAERLPRNRRLPALESYGQGRLFERWGDDSPDVSRRAA